MPAGVPNNDNGVASVTVPTGGYTIGQIYGILDSYVVAMETKAAAATGLVMHSGVIDVVKATGTGKSFAYGDEVFYKSNKAEPTTSTGAVPLDAIALETAGTTATTVRIRLFSPIPQTA